MKTALAIFVKTPTRSPVKTRLAASIGTDKAIHFFKLCIAAVQETAKQSNITPYWAIAEKNASHDSIWQSFPIIHTGDGCLGTRQSSIYETLLKSHDQVILIGADAPQLSCKTINAAMIALHENDYVIGPANDGGYYLFGGNKSIPLNVWTKTPWSSDQTRTTFIKNLGSSPYQLPPLTDIDTIEDLKTLTSEMPNPMSIQQKALIDWIKTL